MLYTNRRASVPDAGPGDGVAWVHGTRIGIAKSTDGGASWSYVGTADIDLAAGGAQTHWAPAVLRHEDVFHMYLTHVPGVFTDWKHPRQIVHLISPDLKAWDVVGPIELASDRVIDADIIRLPDGRWRMFYNEERDNKAVCFADSDDLFAWTDRGKAYDGPPGEGPVAFFFGDRFWLIVDEWKGLGVYHSGGADRWTRQEGPNLLNVAGTGADDAGPGHHADVVVNDGRAYLFYFTHPGRRLDGTNGPGGNLHQQRRSVVQVTELVLKAGRLTCDRDAPTRISLAAPA